MPDSPTFHIGGISGGQNNLAGDHNTFHQTNHGFDAAAVAGLLATLRGHLDDFTDPPAAEKALEVIEREPQGGRAGQALKELMGYVRPGSEALTAVTALVTAVRGVVG